jgi:hypothetical protein
VFDGTSSLSAAVLPGPGDAATLSATSWMAVSFTALESDTTCGPGRYSMTVLDLALSQQVEASADLQIRLYTANVRHARAQG